MKLSPRAQGIEFQTPYEYINDQDLEQAQVSELKIIEKERREIIGLRRFVCYMQVVILKMLIRRANANRTH